MTMKPNKCNRSGSKKPHIVLASILGSTFLLGAALACDNEAASSVDTISDGCRDCPSWGWATGKGLNSPCTSWQFDKANSACSCSKGTLCGFNDFEFSVNVKRLSGYCDSSISCFITSMGSYFGTSTFQHFTSTCPT